MCCQNEHQLRSKCWPFHLFGRGVGVGVMVRVRVVVMIGDRGTRSYGGWRYGDYGMHSGSVRSALTCLVGCVWYAFDRGVLVG